MWHVGTSGWQYRHWRSRFYPPKLASRSWLEHYAAAFATVEVNNTFYRLPARATFEDWRARAPHDFVFACKASNYLTHYRRLREPAEPVARLLDRLSGLGEKTGPVLVQLPPDLRADAARLDATLCEFGRRARVAVEPRHSSWFSEEIRAVLAAHGAALCVADRGSRLVTPLWATADWTYVRFHFGRSQPVSCYGRRALQTWVARVRDLVDVHGDAYIYFNNDGHGCAVRDAVVFADLARRAGCDVTRVPPLSAAPVG